jgi:hypothetical protein
VPITSTNRSSHTLTYALVIALSAAVLSFFNLTRDNGWGDDFAGYILQARSIVRGDMDELVSKNILAVERSSGDLAPANYPWGFPLMLAPVYALFGTKVLALKLVLTLCHALLVLAAFLLARTRLSAFASLILAAVIAYNAVLITEGQGEILSDLPFALFSTIALWLIVRPAADSSTRRAEVGRGILTGVAIFMAVFIRPNGLLLLVPLGAMHLPGLQRESVAGRRSAARAVLVPAVTVGLLHALQASLFPSAALRDVSFSIAPASLWSMLLYYLPLPAYFFRHLGPAAWLIYGVQVALIVLSLLAHWRRDLPLHAFVLATIVLYVAFPYKQGVRYLYPVWPVLVVLTFDGIQAAAQRLGPAQGRRLKTFLLILWSAVALLSLGIGTRLAALNMAQNRSQPGRTWGAFSPGSTAMFDFISDHTPPDSVIIFYKPRAMRLRTERDAFLTTDCTHLPKSDYVVTVESNGTYDQIAPELVESCNAAVRLTLVYAKDLFIVYQIQPAQ